MESKDKIRISVDLDGTIRNFTRAFNVVYNKLILASGSTAQVPIDHEPTVYSIADDPLYKPNIVKQVFNEHMAEAITIAGAYPGALQFVQKLAAIPGTEYTFTTHALSKAAKKASYSWVYREQNFLAAENWNGIIFCVEDRYKYGDILIDDKTDNLNAAQQHKVIPICVARAWNEDFKGERYKDYDVLLDAVKESVALLSD